MSAKVAKKKSATTKKAAPVKKVAPTKPHRIYSMSFASVYPHKGGEEAAHAGGGR